MQPPDPPPAKPKICVCCKKTSSDPDPVAPQRYMRWEKPNYRGSSDYYCARVHERRYGKLTRSQLQSLLATPAPDENTPSEMDKFMSARSKCIEILTKQDRLPPEFAAMFIDAPKKSVEHRKGKYEHTKRKGTNMRLDVFTQRFPTIDPKKHTIFERQNRKGVMQKWVKIYDDVEGVEEFSEGEEEVVEQVNVVDDGMCTLDDSQLQDAFSTAVDATLVFSEQVGCTLADLGASSRSVVAPQALATHAAPGPGASKRKSTEEEELSQSSGDDDVAPVQRAVISNSLLTPQKRTGTDPGSGSASKAKNAHQCEQLATAFTQRSPSILSMFSSCLESDVGSVTAEVKKFMSESKNFDPKIASAFRAYDVAPGPGQRWARGAGGSSS